MKSIKDGGSNRINLVIFLLIVIAGHFCSCCSKGERMINRICSEPDSVYIYPINFFFGHNWDELYVMSGPREEIEIEEIIGTEYDEGIIPDNTTKLVFVRDGEIVKRHNSCRRIIHWHLCHNLEKGYAKLTNTTKIQVSLRFVGKSTKKSYMRDIRCLN